MAQKSGFFNSINNDRVYDASDVAEFLSKYFTNGVFNDTLLVTSNDNMTVSVATGDANINGYSYKNTESLVLDIDESDSELNRIDSVIVRLDLTNRQITTMILQGSYASEPSQPSIVRTGNIYDLRIANIYVGAGATRITSENITDTRLGTECGNVTSLSNSIAISNTEPTNENIKLWINLDGVIKFRNENNEWQVIVSGGSYETIGTTKIYFGSTEPDGYKFVNGQAISRETYSELFSLIGTTYGTGDGSTTFNLPDMSGKVPVGLKVNTEWFARLGQTGGSETHTLTIAEMPIHDHGNIRATMGSSGEIIANTELDGGDSQYGLRYQLTNSTGGKMKTMPAGEGQAHNNLQPYMTVNYIMKVKNIASEQTIVPDYVPIGTVLDYEGTTVPDGYEEVNRVIYESPTGEDLDLICSENPSNYDYLQFDFLHQNYHSSAIAPIIDNKIQISSVGVPTGNTTVQTIVQRYTINGTTLEYDGEGMVNFENKNISWQSYDTDLTSLKVKRIIGFKI